MRLLRRTVTATAGAALAGAALLSQPALANDPVLVVFAIDTSGSLRATDLARAGELAAGILGDLPPATEAAVFAFDDQARVVVPLTSSRGAIRDALAGLRRQGRHTALHDALYDAARYLRDAGAGRRALVLITDGRDEESAVDLADGLAVAQQAGIPVFTVGVGRVEERVLRRVAKLTGGSYAPLRTVRSQTIAAGIVDFEKVPATAGAAGPGTRGDGAGTGASKRPKSPSAPDAPVGAETPRPGRARTLAWIATGIVLLLAVAVAFRGRRRASEVFAAAPADDPAPTLLERMSSTEEYLEKTVTLRERPVLTITRGPGIGQVFDLGNQAATSIGRAKANEVVVDDVSVSSEHCRIRPEDGHYVLHDLKSTNGTFVNERRVARHVLTEGDVVKIGETSLLFRTDLKRT